MATKKKCNDTLTTQVGAHSWRKMDKDRELLWFKSSGLSIELFMPLCVPTVVEDDMWYCRWRDEHELLWTMPRVICFETGADNNISALWTHKLMLQLPWEKRCWKKITWEKRCSKITSKKVPEITGKYASTSLLRFEPLTEMPRIQNVADKFANVAKS
jgi:hypothetical protein